MLKKSLIPLLIGLCMSASLAFLSYVYIDRQNQNSYTKEDSDFFDSLEILQHRYDDIKLSQQPHRETSARTALIAIDEDSVEEIGRWPWSRDIITQITDQLLKLGVKVVAFDVVFSEPESTNPKADIRLGQLIEQNSDKIILGTAGLGDSNMSKSSQPYQDICHLEGFAYFGGDELIKPNVTFIVDDETENFETYNWRAYFRPIFDKISEITQASFLKENSVKQPAQLSPIQKNALRVQNIRQVHGYCDSWLTANDPFSHDGTPTEIVKIKAHPIPQYKQWLINIPEIQKPANYTAGFNTVFDSSGLIRHYHLFNRIGFKIGSSYIPSIAMQMYLLSEQKQADILISEKPNQNEKYIKFFNLKNILDDKDLGSKLDADEFARIRLNYLGGKNSFYYVSAKDILYENKPDISVAIKNKNGRTERQIVNKNDFFKNRSVVVGATAIGIGDIRNTPVQIAMPGPETHLNAYANLLDKNFIVDFENAQMIIPLLTLIIGLITALIWSIVSPLWAPFLYVSFLVIFYFIDFELFIHKKIMTTTWPIYFVTSFTFIVIILYKYFTEERSRQKIKQTFSKYVSPAIVNEILKSEKNLALGGKKQRLTVMFSDLRGFTTLSEKLEPDVLSQFLNTYFTKMTEEVFKANGTLDKFIGDAVMAFFGAPISFKNNAENACRCALNSLKRLDELNIDFKQKGFPILDMGIGLNTGNMSVGNMGSDTLQSYTVLGDAVNLASRLESLNKDYGCHIIVGEETFKETQNLFVFRELDLVRVKGKKTAAPIYELVSDLTEVEKSKAWLEKYLQARTYFKNKNFTEALGIYMRCIELNPQDKTSALFIERCLSLIQNPPAANWDGVYAFEHK